MGGAGVAGDTYGRCLLNLRILLLRAHLRVPDLHAVPRLVPHVAHLVARVRSYGKQDTLGLAQADPGLGKPEARALAPSSCDPQLPAAPDTTVDFDFWSWARTHMRTM